MEPAELVAGHSLEINALTDIAFTASLTQIQLCSRFLQEVTMAFNVLRISPSLHTRGPLLGHSFDSGVDCNASSTVESQSVLQAAATVEVKPESVVKEAVKPEYDGARFVPCEVLVTARTLSVSFHSVEPYKLIDGKLPPRSSSWRKLKHRNLERKRSQTLHSNVDNPTAAADESDNNSSFRAKRRFRHMSGIDDGYEASEEGSDRMAAAGTVGGKCISKIHPLVHCSLMQPHLFMTCSPLSQKLEASVFDIVLSIPAPKYFITSYGRCMPGVQDFSRTLLLTRPGVPDDRSGIPPCLVTLSLTDFLKTKMSVALKLERPVKMNLSTSIVSDLLRSKELISTALDYPAEQRKIFVSLSTCFNFRGELLLNLEFRVPFVKFCKIT